MPFAFLTGISSKIIILLVIFLGGLGTGTYFTKAVEQNKYKTLELHYKEAQVKAVEEAQRKQHNLDLISMNSSRREAQAQAALAAKAQRQLIEVSKHVKNTRSGCITYGFVRVLDSAVHGVNATDLNLPTRKSDDSCTRFGAADVAQSVVGNYNRANQNAEQLNQLTGYVRNVQTQMDKWRADYDAATKHH